jgi:hypothetical protein
MGVMESAATAAVHHDSAAGHGVPAEPSVSSALEHLVAGSQGVITKRIDLALLEGHELLSRSIERGVLVGAGIVLAAAAWFAAAGAGVLFVFPTASPLLHLTAFGVLNAGGALGLVALAMRRNRAQMPAIANGRVSSTPRSVDK